MGKPHDCNYFKYTKTIYFDEWRVDIFCLSVYTMDIHSERRISVCRHR